MHVQKGKNKALRGGGVIPSRDSRDVSTVFLTTAGNHRAICATPAVSYINIKSNVLCNVTLCQHFLNVRLQSRSQGEAIKEECALQLGITTDLPIRYDSKVSYS